MEFLYEGLRKRGKAVHSDDLLVLVKRARTLGLYAFGVDIFDEKGRLIDTFVPLKSNTPFWYEELAEEFVRRYKDCYFSFSFVPAEEYEKFVKESLG